MCSKFQAGLKLSMYVQASEELSAEAPETQSRMLRAAMAVPPLAWQPLTPQLFSRLAQDKVITFPSPRPLKGLTCMLCVIRKCLSRGC